jgi:hypothetical protein
VRVLASVGILWACLGARGLGSVVVNLVQGVHEQLQESQGKAADMVRGDGCERRKGWHGG